MNTSKSLIDKIEVHRRPGYQQADVIHNAVLDACIDTIRQHEAESKPSYIPAMTHADEALASLDNQPIFDDEGNCMHSGKSVKDTNSSFPIHSTEDVNKPDTLIGSTDDQQAFNDWNAKDNGKTGMTSFTERAYQAWMGAKAHYCGEIRVIDDKALWKMVHDILLIHGVIMRAGDIANRVVKDISPYLKRESISLKNILANDEFCNQLADDYIPHDSWKQDVAEAVLWAAGIAYINDIEDGSQS